MKSYLPEFISLMRHHKLNEIVIKIFAEQYEKVLKGESGAISDQEIDPPSKDNIVEYNNLTDEDPENLDKLVIIKLNGGLGTSMGLSKAKSLLRVREQLTFLDIISLQVLQMRMNTGKVTPLMFMDSFNTSKDTLEYLKKYKDLKVKDLPLDFLQNKFPKIKQEDLSPLKEKVENLNWNPPGHGEIFTVLYISGILDKLLKKGYEYAFISNSDNLGAVADNRILNYMIKSEVSFIIEVCRRTEMDKKGGHLAAAKDGQLLLREVAQCPNDEISSFQDINKYKYFNTNNIWLNLKSLKLEMKNKDYVLSLPLILNKKEVNSTKVYQIESAMGAAVSSFKNSKAIKVDRNRFIPVKKTNDLLCVWSDAYELTRDFDLILNTTHGRSPNILLDEKYFKLIDQLQERIIEVPSLKNCENLTVDGNVYFEKNVTIENSVVIKTSDKLVLKNKVFS